MKSFNLCLIFCPPFCLSEFKVGAVNHFNFTVLIDMLLTNQNAEIVACILLCIESYGSLWVRLLYEQKLKFKPIGAELFPLPSDPLVLN